MTDQIFDKVIAKAKLQTGTEELESVWMTATAFGYHISFIGESESGHNIQIEDFGFESKDGWEEIEPTDNQIEKMQKILNDQVNVIEGNINGRQTMEAERLEAIEDERKYGRPDTIFNSTY